ncbi:hypothetical protein T01_2631 [Trichinella spiralis]|uniref:Uncharacterized protein n=1 Tax=Trichinella spiralis TaxID=6334 RepID=A0A0V0YQG2_TRISP|nr:hypothetical protein T01_2631 [Trichinella spiralis]
MIAVETILMRNSRIIKISIFSLTIALFMFLP